MNNTTQNETSLKEFKLVSAITITMMALFGNTIALFILTRPDVRKLSLFRYLVIATIFDNLNALSIWPTFYRDSFLINDSKIICKFYFYIGNVTGTFSSLMNTLISIDIYLDVKFPRKFAFIKRIKFQLILVLVIFCISCIFNQQFFIFLSIDIENIKFSCTSKEMDALNASALVIQVIVPFLLTCLFSYLIYRQLASIEIQSNDLQRVEKQKKLFKVMLGMAFLFLIIQLPLCIISLTSGDNELIFNLFYSLSYAYYSLDIIVYSFTNRVFRERLLSMLSNFLSLITCKT